LHKAETLYYTIGLAVSEPCLDSAGLWKLCLDWPCPWQWDMYWYYY